MEGGKGEDLTLEKEIRKIEEVLPHVVGNRLREFIL